MAGYVFSIGNENPQASIRKYAQDGIFSVYVNAAKATTAFEGTLADYISMRPGDNIYFFCKRKIYGIGELVAIGSDCKYCNYPEATNPVLPDYKKIKAKLLVDYGEDSPHCRWLCAFHASPCFFDGGVDMDEVFAYKPHTFKMLRAFWKLSFIKLGDEENESLREFILLRNQGSLPSPINETPFLHHVLAQKALDEYRISTRQLLRSVSAGDQIRHEMALEAATIEALYCDAIKPLGHWDYISHQVVASPFKPIDYMDKIDIFAYRFLTKGLRIPCKFLVAELKAGQADEATIDQVLKYVDWVCHEYAYGDYGAIEACIIAHSYSPEALTRATNIPHRQYTTGSHPAKSLPWAELRLLCYRYCDDKVEYYDETPKTI